MRLPGVPPNGTLGERQSQASFVSCLYSTCHVLFGNLCGFHSKSCRLPLSSRWFPVRGLREKTSDISCPERESWRQLLAGCGSFYYLPETCEQTLGGCRREGDLPQPISPASQELLRVPCLVFFFFILSSFCERLEGLSHRRSSKEAAEGGGAAFPDGSGAIPRRSWGSVW